MAEDSKKRMEEKMIMYQILQRQLEVYREQMVQLEREMAEIESTKQTVGDLKNIKKENSVMIPLGSGLFIEGTITKTKNILMSPGANMMVEKNFESALDGLSEKEKQIEKASRRLQDESGKVAEQLNALTPELEKLVRESQEK